MISLKLIDVCKYFGEFTASENISFEVEEGSFVTLLGPSGCGKTTLLKTIGGFHNADKGKIYINGQDVSHLPPEKRDTAMCFQSYALFPHLSVRKNIAFGLEQQGMKGEDKQIRIKESMAQVDIGNQALKIPSELSGGQQQRVALARAMAPRPSIILFDEPLSNLDAKLREKVRFEIRALQKELGFTAVYVTHDQSEALAMSDTVIVLNAGHIEQMGAPKEIYNQPKNRFVADFIGAANIMKAKVVGSEDHIYHLESEVGPLTAHSLKPPEGEYIYICWRPEDAQMAHDQNSNIIQAHVEKTAFLGNYIDVFAKAADTNVDFRLEMSQKDNIQDGAEISFHLNPSDIRLLEVVQDE